MIVKLRVSNNKRVSGSRSHVYGLKGSGGLRRERRLYEGKAAQQKAK